MSATNIAPGGTITISGTGYIPGETVVLDISYAPLGSALRHSRLVFAQAAGVVASTTADATGSWTITLRLDQVGIATITATGLTSGKVSTTVVTVGGPGFEGTPAPMPSTTLPTTAPPTAGPPITASPSTALPTVVPVDNGAGGPLAETGAGIDITAAVATGIAALLVGLVLTLLGARGAFGRRFHP